MVRSEPILQFFVYNHLPEHLQEVSRPFGELALVLMGHLPRNPERTVALRKLLEAKDAAVRARLYQCLSDQQSDANGDPSDQLKPPAQPEQQAPTAGW